MRRTILYAGAGAAAVLLSLLLTPLGVYLLARAVEQAAPRYGWKVEIGSTAGSLLGRPRFEEVRAGGRSGSPAIAVPSLSATIWGREVAVESPRIEIDLSRPDSAATPAVDPPPPPPAAPEPGQFSLPLDDIPFITVSDAELALRDDNLLVLAKGIGLRFELAPASSSGPSSGRPLRITAPDVQLRRGETGASGALEALFTVEADRLAADSLSVRASTGKARFTAAGTGTLGLTESLPLHLETAVSAQSPSRRGEGLITLSGPMAALDLDVAASGALSDSVFGSFTGTAAARVTGERISVDSLLIESAGGEGRMRLQGEYAHGAGDSLRASLEIAGQPIAPLVSGAADGLLSATLKAGGRAAWGELDARLVARLSGLRPEAATPLDLTLEVHLDGPGLTAALESTLGSVAAAGTVAGPDRYAVDLRGKLDAGPLIGTPMPAVVTGHLSPGELVADLTVEELPLLGPEFGQLSVRASVEDWRKTELTLSLDSGGMLAGVETDLKAGSVDTLHAAIQPTRLDRLLPELSGSVTAGLEAGSFDWDAARLGATIALQEVGYRGWSAGDIDTGISFDDGTTRVLLRGRGLHAEARLEGTGRFSATARLDSVTATRRDPVSDRLDHLLLSGNLSASGETGRPEVLSAELLLEQVELLLHEQVFQAIEPVRATHDSGVTEIAPLSLATPAGTLTASARAADSLWARAAIDSVFLTLVDGALTARGTLELRLRGTADRPELDGELELFEVHLLQRPLGRLQAAVSHRDSTVAVVELTQPEGSGGETKAGSLAVRLAMPGTALSGDASAGERAHLGIGAGGLDLGPVLSYALDDSVGGSLGLSGALSFPADGLASGIAWTSLSGSARLSHLEIEKGSLHLQLPDEGAEFRLGGEEPQHVALALARLDEESGGYDHPAGSVSAGLESAPGRNRITLELAEVDLLSATALGIGESALPAGTVDAVAALTDSAGERSLSLTAAAETEEFGDLTADVEVAGGLATLQTLWSTPLADEVAVSGSVPVHPRTWKASWERAELSARTEGVNLFIFVDQVPDLETLDGLVRFDLAATRLGSDPQVHGELEVEEVGFRFIDVAPGYAFPRGRIEFSGRRGILTDFTGYPSRGEGECELSGHLEISADRLDYDLVLALDGVPYGYDDVFLVPGARGRLRFRSQENGSLFEGELQLDDGISEPPLVDITAPPLPPPPPALQDPFLETIHLDLRVDVREMAVRNELADLLLEGSGHVYGTFYKPRIQGEMFVQKEGTVIALNNEFVFEKRGRIILDRLVPTYSILDLAYDPLLLDAELDLEAVAKVRDKTKNKDLDVTMSLRGSTLRAKPDFTAIDPDDGPLEFNQVIFLLAFGTSQTEGIAERDIYHAAGTAVGQLLLGDQLQRIGLDEFQLLPSGTTLETSGKPALRIGKHFRWPLPLWVRYEAVSDDPSIGEAQVEYQFSRFITLRAKAQSEYERYGVGLGVKKQF